VAKSEVLGTNYHAVQFYKDDDSLATTAANFLADGIELGEPALIVATSAHSSRIIAAMAACGVNTDELRRTGELTVFDAKKMLSSFMVNSMPDTLLFKSNVGDVIERLCAGRAACPVRAYGEMVDVLWQEGNVDGAIRLEILWNQLASAYEFSLLCGYAVGHFYKETTDARLRDVCSHHSHVIPPA
jgi:hypothetical protein